MKIAFDIHGTLDAEPALRGMADLLAQDANNTIYIISGPRRDRIIRRLRKLGMNPDKFVIVSIVDYLEAKGVEFVDDERGNPFCNEEIWWQSKGDICREYDIEVIIDDSIRYAPNMPATTTFLLNSVI